MCIRDRFVHVRIILAGGGVEIVRQRGRERLLDAAEVSGWIWLLYTSDAADERSSGDFGGRRIIKKKNRCDIEGCRWLSTEEPR